MWSDASLEKQFNCEMFKLFRPKSLRKIQNATAKKK